MPARAQWVAHRTLPCGTPIVVSTGHHTITVEVWDRGPYHDDRDLDLSVAAFRVFAAPEIGVIPVRWRVAAAAR